jgi:hypothetical protein
MGLLKLAPWQEALNHSARPETSAPGLWRLSGTGIGHQAMHTVIG